MATCESKAIELNNNPGNRTCLVTYYNPFSIRDGYIPERKLPVFPAPHKAIHDYGRKTNSVVEYNHKDYKVVSTPSGWRIDQSR